jgi:hypothetical protein
MNFDDRRAIVIGERNQASMNLFIVASAGEILHVEGRDSLVIGDHMKMASMKAMASAIAFLATCFTATPALTKAGRITLREYYCLSSNEGGTDCSFTSYPQCETTASGIGADYYRNSSRDDEGFPDQGPRAGEYQGPLY